MSQVPPQNSSEENPKAAPEGDNPSGHDPESPSADFAALIDAIKKEGRAYRKEEQREDSGKKFRDWITIGLVAATLFVFAWQLREMTRAYKPLQEQAEAAKDSAIAGARAWVGPYQAKLIEPPQPSIEKDWKVEIDYQNTGREPARKFSTFFDPFIEVSDMKDPAVMLRITQDVTACKIRAPAEPAEIVYPISLGLGGSSGYSATISFKKAALDQALLMGERAAYVFGCFTYVTRDAIKHSSFCFFFKEGLTQPNALNICEGADAD